ncbi:MAG: hypothetical protein MMC33_002822 [Icmadophila ericetorum]|nr:hypothetical protein [Icmadophila ericetorum]
MSFMTAFGGSPRGQTPPPQASVEPQNLKIDTQPSPAPQPTGPNTIPDSPTPRTRERAPSRPMSMVGAYQPPLMEIAQDTIPELLPIFTLLNSHSNKLYQEGYFLKLNDLDSHGRPNSDRTWSECFAQLVGTVLSLWDAAALDAAGQDGEVAPTFINLADASIKMIETLPTRAQDVEPLQNVLSISTAGKNRYLFHFNNINSLTQWTAGIRLSMFEHATLQEAYTGSLIAGKGKSLNNIRVIMERNKLKAEDWARVRFGAGTPWRRCWCVISPPDEKESAKTQKSLKKKSAYDHSTPVLKGDIKFYDTRKIKKASPIATIKEAYSCYAIYPQSKPLIDQSTLVKLEGTITIHSQPETTTEGFVFVMPEVHPAVSGFEIMLRWLFPTYDVFGLYGRPSRLIADTLDTRSLMFALPQEKRYGYLEIFDVATLIHTEGSQSWSEREWRKRLKELTSERMTKMRANPGSRTGSRAGSRRGHRNSLPSRTGALRFEDGASMRSTPSLHRDLEDSLPRADSVPPGLDRVSAPSSKRGQSHQRSASETTPFSTPRRQRTIDEGRNNYTPSRLSHEAMSRPTPEELIAPPPPTHAVPSAPIDRNPQLQRYAPELENANERTSSDSERRVGILAMNEPRDIEQDLMPSAPPAPVAKPPAFSHQPGAKPATAPYQAPELRRANSRMSNTTLSQLAAASAAGENQNIPATVAAAGAAAAWRKNQPQEGGAFYIEDQSQHGVNDYYASKSGATADSSSYNEGMRSATAGRPRQGNQRTYSSSPNRQPHTNTPSNDLRTLPLPIANNSLAAPTKQSRSPSPLSQPLNPPILPNQHAPSSGSSVVDSYYFQDQDQHLSIHPQKPSHSASSSISATSQTSDTSKPNPRQSISRKPLPSRSGSSSALPTSPDYNNDPSIALGYDDRSAETAQPRRSFETRPGVLKIVGPLDSEQKDIVIGDVVYRQEDSMQQLRSEIPNVDFGPTRAVRPGTSDGPRELPQASHNRSISADHLIPNQQRHPRDISPGRTQDRGSESTNYGPVSGDIERENRNIAWQPGATIGNRNLSPGQTISPEQFVQQRATTSRATPVYAHGRKPSGTPPQHSRQNSSTPPTSRHGSNDWTNQNRYQQPRGTSPMRQGSADYPAGLSAREQEHVARVTGSPLVSVDTNRKVAPQGTGLIGAIEAREREKKEIKQGISNQAVQHAIAHRQQGYNYSQPGPNPSPRMEMPGQFPQTPQESPYDRGNMAQQQQAYPQQQQFHQANPYQKWQTPAQQIYWNTPLRVPPQSRSDSPQTRQQQQVNPYQSYQQSPYDQGQALGQQQGQQQQQPQQSQQQYNAYFASRGQGSK